MDGEPVITWMSVPKIMKLVKAINTPIAAVVMTFRPWLAFSCEPPAVNIRIAPQAKKSPAKAIPHCSIKVIRFLTSSKSLQRLQSGPEQGTKPWAEAILVNSK